MSQSVRIFGGEPVITMHSVLYDPSQQLTALPVGVTPVAVGEPGSSSRSAVPGAQLAHSIGWLMALAASGAASTSDLLL